MCHGCGDSCAVLAPPRRYLSSVSGLVATKAGFTLMGVSCGFEGGSGSGSSAIASLLDAHALNACDLGQHSYDEFADFPTDRAETVDVERDAHIQQPSDHGLNVESIAADSISI